MSVPPEQIPPEQVAPEHVAPVPPSPPVSSAGEPTPEERQWALFTHLSALIGFVIPFGNVIAPLVLWLIKKDTLPYANSQGKEAVNFNITIAIAAVVSTILCLVVVGVFLLFALFIVWLVFVVIATVNASNGVAYRYPMTIRFIQ